MKKKEADITALLGEALRLKRANDQRGSLFALKRKKLLEKEVAKLEGQLVLLEQ